MQRPAGHREVKLSLHDHPRQCLRDIVVNPQPDIWITATEPRYRRGNQFIDRRRTAPDRKRPDPLNATRLQPGYRTVETIQQRGGFLHKGHCGSCRRRGRWLRSNNGAPTAVSSCWIVSDKAEGTTPRAEAAREKIHAPARPSRPVGAEC